MYITSQKSEFSVAFVHAVASVAGYTFMSPPHVDAESVDLELGGSKSQGKKRRAPRLDVQVKCTETDDGAGDVLSYPLKMKNYNDLRIEDVHVPHILVVLCIPADLGDWLHETEAETAMRRVAYWCSLRGHPEVPNETTRTIAIPRTQRFTVQALRDMMTRIGEGGLP